MRLQGLASQTVTLQRALEDTGRTSSLFFLGWLHRLPLDAVHRSPPCTAGLPFLLTWAEASMALAEQIRGSKWLRICLLDSDCTPVSASSHLLGTGKALKCREGAAWKITKELLASPSSINIWNLCSRASTLFLKINVLARVVIHLKNILSLLHPSFLFSQHSERKKLPFLFHLLRMHLSAVTLTGLPSKPRYVVSIF